MTVIITSSPRRSLKLVPKMMFASGSAAARISSAASVTSNRLRFDEPVMLKRMPWAPWMLTSSSGLAIAWRAASTARFSPVARPMPMSADPASFMIARTSAKSRLIRPGIVMMSLIPWTPWRRTSSTTRNASMIEVFFWTTSLSRSFGIVISVSTWALSSSAAFSAMSLRLAPSNAERLRHDADRQRAGLLGHLGDDRGGAGAGPAAEPGGDEHHVRVDERLGDLLGVLLGRALADRAVAAGAEAAGDLVADPDLVRRVGLEERLRVRVAGDELDAHHLGPDHPVDGVAAAAADPDDPDQREVLESERSGIASPPVAREVLDGQGKSKRALKMSRWVKRDGQTGLDRGADGPRLELSGPISRSGKMLRSASLIRPKPPIAGANS